MDGLMADLVGLEVELHTPMTRRDRARLGELLHDDFREIGRSGATYGRQEVLSSLPDDLSEATIKADRFRAELQCDSLVLLTYRTVCIGEDGAVAAHTLRSSLWQRSGDRWQMRFHQGTPTTPFDLDTA